MMQKLAIAHGEEFPPDSNTYQTPATYLRQAVDRLPDGQLISWHLSDEGVTQTYSQFWDRATCVLGGLRSRDLKAGQPIVVLLDHCQDFVTALWSCFMGGFVPVPIRFSANLSQPNQPRLRLQHVLEMLETPAILTTTDIAPFFQHQNFLGNQSSVIYLEDVEASSPDDQIHPGNPEDLGALFLSSGTTGKPKLVSFNCWTIVNRFLANHPGNPQDICSLYWLPLDHASASLRIANPEVQQKIFLPTEAFLVDPLRWLDLIERYRVTQTNITNFGMALISESIKSSPHRSWDLTSLQNIGIGAESIIPKTYYAFVEVLQPFGLNPDTIFAGYGLTECGTVVGGNVSVSLGAGEAHNQFMSLGKPCRGYSIRIVDEQNALLNEEKIGYVQIKGPSTATGYYSNIEETRLLFGDDGWMNTGDLGFIQDGNLTITGRAKDVIIINAKNYSCQEIEQVVEAIAGVEPMFTVACAIRQPDSTTDELAIFFNTSIDEEQHLVNLMNQIRITLSTQLGVTPTYLVPIAKEAIPRTALGKVQRNKLAQQLEAGEFVTLFQSLDSLIKAHSQTSFIAPRTKTERVIAAIWSEILHQESIGVYDNFFELGGRSLLAAQVIATISQQVGIELPFHYLFENPTLAELAYGIDAQTFNSTFHTALVKLQPNGAKTPLYFVNSTLQAQALAPLLPPDQPIYGLNIFGLSYVLEKQLNHLQISDLANYFIRDLKVTQPSGPYQLIGYCQDGALTLETAQRLQSQGEEVELVCFIDVFFEKQPLALSNRLKALSELGLFYVGAKLRGYVEKVKRLVGVDQHVVEAIVKPDTESEDHSELIDKIQRDRHLYSAYLQAISAYHPQPYKGRIVLLQSTEWSLKDQSKLQDLAIDGLESHLIKGLHNNLFEEPFIQNLAGKLRVCLNAE